MNLSEVADNVIRLRQQNASADESVARYLETTLRGAGLQVQVQPFHYSVHEHAWLGVVVLLLSIIFLAGVFKRRHRAAFAAAIAVSLILLSELSFDFPVVSWPVLRKGENIVVQFPVQNPARKLIVGTSYGYNVIPPRPPNRFEQTVSAFLLPMTLVLSLLGIWQLGKHFGKFDFEDARTIALVMGAVCVIYYALWLGKSARVDFLEAGKRGPGNNAGSVAVLTGLALDLSKKYPRLENTWVTVAFFGGPDGSGERKFARSLPRNKTGAIPTDFIYCREIGRGGRYAYLIAGEETPASFYADRELVRVLDRAAVAVTGHRLEMATPAESRTGYYADEEFATISITTLPGSSEQSSGEKPGFDEIHRGQLLPSLQLIEKALIELDEPRFLLGE